MAKNETSNQPFSMEQAMAFAGTLAGRQLITLLQSKGSPDIQKAKSLAEAGRMEDAGKALSSLLSDPQIRELLKNFGG